MKEKEQPVPTFKHCNSFGRNCLKHVVLIKSMYQSSINQNQKSMKTLVRKGTRPPIIAVAFAL